jgi:CRP-like cAMP-binding protein
MNLTATAPAVHLRCALFEGISPAEQQEILADATLRSYAARQALTDQGSRADRFFLLLSGCARLFVVTETGKKLPLLWVRPGDVIGGMGVLLQQRNYLVSCEAVVPSQIYVWKRDTIRRHFTRMPRLLDNGLHIASGYVESLLAAHIRLICNTARERLAEVLTEYAAAVGQPCSEGVMIDATNEEFAQAANITKYTTCRLLAEWQKTGAISKTRGMTILRNPKHLV